MGNIIRRDKILRLLEEDGNIGLLISDKEKTALKKFLFANKTRWTKISDLPQLVYNEFENKMRTECYITEQRMPKPPAKGPHIVFSKRDNRLSCRIDNSIHPKGIAHYRKCLAVVAYYVGICGGIVNPQFANHEYEFSDEDWILISIAARYCLLPGKLIQKVYLLTQMYESEGALSRDKSFLQNFVDNLVFQTQVPEWVVYTRLHEHSVYDDEFAHLFNKKTIEALIEEYRENEHYTDELSCEKMAL